MALSTSKMFQLEWFKRKLQTCRDPDELREIGTELLTLYLKQQELFEALTSKGWLPKRPDP